jgi:hypothetical protein
VRAVGLQGSNVQTFKHSNTHVEDLRHSRAGLKVSDIQIFKTLTPSIQIF